jgi:hypothetical protein
MADRQNRSFTTGSALATGPTQIGGPNPTQDYNTYVDLYTDVSQSQGSSTYVGESLFMFGIDNQVTGSAYSDYPMKGVMVGGTGNKLGAISEYFDYSCQIFGANHDICYTSNPSQMNYGYGSFYVGRNHSCETNYGHFVAGTSNTVSGSSWLVTILGSGNNARTIKYGFLIGQGNGTMVGGNSQGGGGCIGKDNIVHGISSVAIGSGNTASGNYTYCVGNSNDAERGILFGDDNTSRNAGTIMFGETNTCANDGRSMIAVGRENTNAVDSSTIFTIGSGNTNVATATGNTILIGTMCEAASPNSLVTSFETNTTGKKQEVKSFLTATTTNATPTVCTTKIYPKVDSAMGFSYTVTARRTDVDGHNAYWTGSGLITNEAGTVDIIGSVSKTEVAKVGFTTVDIAFTEDASDDTLILTVTGEAGETIIWHAIVTQNIVVG